MDVSVNQGKSAETLRIADFGLRIWRATLGSDQVDDEALLGEANRVVTARFVDQRLRELPASGISVCMQDARVAVAAFQSKGEIVRVAGLLIKIRAPGEQLENALGSFFDHQPHRILIAQSHT